MLQYFMGMLELELQKPYAVVMEFCLGCGADLPNATKEKRTLSSESTVTSTLKSWSHPSMELSHERGSGESRVFLECFISK